MTSESARRTEVIDALQVFMLNLDHQTKANAAISQGTVTELKNIVSILTTPEYLRTNAALAQLQHLLTFFTTLADHGNVSVRKEFVGEVQRIIKLMAVQHENA